MMVIDCIAPLYLGLPPRKGLVEIATGKYIVCRLDLPPYESYQQLRDKLIKVKLVWSQQQDFLLNLPITNLTPGDRRKRGLRWGGLRSRWLYGLSSVCGQMNMCVYMCGSLCVYVYQCMCAYV